MPALAAGAGNHDHLAIQKVPKPPLAPIRVTFGHIVLYMFLSPNLCEREGGGQWPGRRVCGTILP